MNNRKTLWVTWGLIILGAASRLLPHPPNVTPLAAMALLGGAYLPSRQALIFPVAAMAVSDLFLGFHSTIPFVYGWFLLAAGIGLRLKERRTWKTVGAACVGSSVLFFLITNFGTWLAEGLYPRTLPGLAACYAAGLPFYRNTLLGDVFFTGLLFGLERLAGTVPIYGRNRRMGTVPGVPQAGP